MENKLTFICQEDLNGLPPTVARKSLPCGLGTLIKIRGKSNPVGEYLLKEADIMDLKSLNESAGKTSGKIRDRFAIPGKSPKYISEVKVPVGTKMYIGPVGKNFGESEGATQYVLRGQLPESNFGRNIKTIEEWKNGN